MNDDRLAKFNGYVWKLFEVIVKLFTVKGSKTYISIVFELLHLQLRGYVDCLHSNLIVVSSWKIRKSCSGVNENLH
jgi:hypothetical protein